MERSGEQAAALIAALTETTTDFIGVADANGRVLFLNRAARELHDLTDDVDLSSVNANEFFAPWSLDVLHAEMPSALAHGDTWAGELALLDSEGVEIPVSSVTSAYRDDGGEVAFFTSIAREVTERVKADEARHQMEAALRASEIRFRSLAEHSSDLVLATTAEGVVTYLSPSAERFTGLDADAMIGRRFPQVVHPDDLARVQSMYAAPRDDRNHDGSSKPFAFRIRHRSGEWRWLEAVTTNLLDVPSVAAIVTNARDVTDRIEAQAMMRKINEALWQSNETLRALVDSSPLAIHAYEPNGVITHWNRACESMYGWRSDEVVGRFAPMIPEDDLEEFALLRERVVAGEHVTSAEVRRCCRDGRILDVSLSVAPIRDEHDEVRLVLAVCADVTSQRQAERALRESEERFRALVQHSSDIITVLEADGTMRYSSGAAQRILGYPEGWGIGEDVFEYIHPDDQVTVKQLFFETVEHLGSEGIPVEFRMRHADGEYRYVEAIANNLLEDPAINGIVITTHETTVRRLGEESVRQSEERLRSLVQNLNDIITIVDYDGRIRWSSLASGLPLGAAPAETFDDHPLNRIHPDDANRVRELLRELPQHSERGPVEFRVQGDGGEWCTVEAFVSNLLDDPNVGGIVFTTSDITERKHTAEELATSEARYRAIVQDQTELLCRYAPDGTLTFVNDAYVRCFGKSAEELVGQGFMPFVPEEDRAVSESAMEAITAINPVASVEHRVLLPDGRLRWHAWTIHGVFDEQGRVAEYQAVGRDVTEQKDAEALVADQARILEHIARGAPLPETLSEMCRVVEARAPEAICSVMLCSDDGVSLRLAAAPSMPDSYVQAVDGVPIGPAQGSCGTAAYRGERVVVTDISADPFWVTDRELAAAHNLRACWSTPILDSTGDRVLGAFAVYYREMRGPTSHEEHVLDLVVQLATIAIERKAFEAKLAHQAHHDPLTALPNRLLFLEFLVLALARAKRYRSTVAVLFLDLDRFKVVNDSLGHDAGDELLIQMARRLQSVVRPGDTVARFGGDEFTILCEDLSGPEAKMQAVDVAERLLEAIHQPFQLEAEETFLSASIGIALAHSSDERPEALLRDADAAMYRAKEHGKGRWELFDEAMRANAMARLETESALHRAIDRGEFRVFYQPIISLTEGRCIGAEALVRWQHSERGLVAPHEFINLAEETGLIIPLGNWVLREAAQQAARWHREHQSAEPFVVSVNLSGRQLAQPDLVDRVAEALELNDCAPGNICLEITESVLMDDAEATIGAIKALKALGVRLSIDDFGTGYSSLGYLKRFPVDSVKVDQSFVDGLGVDPEDSAIVAAVVSLGHALGLTVVAEGVESETQLIELVGLGCDDAQGFYFAPPQPSADLIDLVGLSRSWQPPGAILMGSAGVR